TLLDNNPLCLVPDITNPTPTLESFAEFDVGKPRKSDIKLCKTQWGAGVAIAPGNRVPGSASPSTRPTAGGHPRRARRASSGATRRPGRVAPMKRALRGLQNAATSTIARITDSQGTITTTAQASGASHTGSHTPAADHTAPNPGRYAIDPRGTIAAVIVTHNRVDLLERSLDMVAKQTRRPDWVIVVDNGADPEVETLVHARLGGGPQSRRASAEITARRFAEIQTVGAAITKAYDEADNDVPTTDAAANDDATASTSASSSSAASANVPQRRPRPMYLPSRTNLGGAGGFALGFLAALALGADAIWCADDDDRPADENVLATLMGVD